MLSPDSLRLGHRTSMPSACRWPVGSMRRMN